jgi:ABC-2 type transport system ATP-binding protein
VKDVSFTVEPGEVLGMVGPNGAGKTTTIRMLLDIIQPDEGTVLLFGGPFSREHRALLGYLPEERGLYRDLRVQETLEYLGTLKGMRHSDARRRAAEVLERLDMTEHRNKKIAELSRGMGQLIQLAATMIHQPRLLILDEPFSGLDPLNVRLMKEVLGQMREDGVAIILSTHQMNQVEEFCDKVLMINHGQVVLYGELEEVRNGFGEGSIIVEATGVPENLPGVQKINDYGTYYELVMSNGTSGASVFQALAECKADVRRFEVARLPLEEIFVRIVREE